MPGESQRFRTGASRQDFGGAKLASGIDKVKGLASAEWLFYRELLAIERPMIKLVFLLIVASPEPDASGNVANTTLTALPAAKAPLKKDFKRRK
jgi:hypothetical protein